MTKKPWRMLFGILAVFAIFAVAVACGDDDDDGGEATQPSGSAAPAGTITMQATQFETWDPHFSDFAQDIAHFYMVWRGLYEFDKDQKPIPSMAEGAPSVSSDGKTYTVKLKSGLKWSDGTPMKAQDFVMGMQRTCNYKIAGHYQYILSAVVGCDAYYDAKNKDKTPAEVDTLLKAVGVRAVDDNTVEYKLTDPQPTFSILLAMWPTFPVPSGKVTTVDADWPAPMANVYNGPYMPNAYTEKDKLELVPNPNWAGAQKPSVAKIVLRYIDDAAVANDAYRTGELDAAVADSAQLDKLKTEFPNELKLYPATRTIGLEYNMADPTMAKAEVRLAMSQAVDRDTMMKVVFKDGNTATTNWMPPARSGLPLNNYKDTLGYNVQKAKDNLSKAGYANGAGFPSVTLLLTDTALNRATGEFLQAQWKTNLGIDVKLEFVDSATRSSRFNKEEYQVVTGGWQEDYPDPENWFLGLWQAAGSINHTNTNVPALDQKIKDAQYNTNDEQRRQQYKDAEKLLLDQANGMAPLWHTQAKFLIKPYITGMFENKRPGDTFTSGDWSPEYWKTSKK